MLFRSDVIDINEFKIQASGSSEAKINAAFNGLNNYKKDLLEETKDVDGEIVPNPNEDKCVFTVAVPEGATGNIALDILGKDYFAIDDVVVFRFDNLGADVVFSDVYGWELTTVPAALEAGKPAVVVLVKVDQTDYSAAEFATEAGVNDALDALNVARATYTDEEVAYKFVVDVPAGATGEIALAFAETDNFVAGDQIKLRFDVVGIVDADGVYTVDSQPALTTITGWTMVLSPETLVAGEKAVVTLTKN